jgi:DNA-binding MarR family transcriptional regulator
MQGQSGSVEKKETGKPGEASKLSLRVWLQLMKCSKAIESMVGARLRQKYNQSLGRYDILSQLYRISTDWTTVGEIARNVLAASGNITAVLDRMEREDLVERRPSPTDRRSYQVRMTPSGKKLFRRMTRDHAIWVDEALDSVPMGDKETLVALLASTRQSLSGLGAPERAASSSTNNRAKRPNAKRDQ